MDLDLTGFGVEEVVSLTTPKNAGLTDPDQAPAAPDDPVSLVGDLWLLGEHRVFCGDSVAYKGGMKPREALSGDHLGTDIYDSSLCHLSFAADDKAALYLWYAAKNHAQFMTSAHYKGKHEPCLYGHRRGKSARWHGPNNEVTLWEVNRAPKNEFHPTQKPVDLAARAIRNSTSASHRVLDLFLGSGSTVIAAEMEGRICVGLEIEPAYVDVIVKRWQDFTGKAATLEGDGRSFAEIETARAAPQRRQRKKAA